MGLCMGGLIGFGGLHRAPAILEKPHQPPSCVVAGHPSAFGFLDCEVDGGSREADLASNFCLAHAPSDKLQKGWPEVCVGGGY